MRKVFLIIVGLICFLITGCQHEKTIITEEQIQQMCITVISERYNSLGWTDNTLQNLNCSWLCNSKSEDSEDYKVLCSFDAIINEQPLYNNTAMISFTYDKKTKSFTNSEVSLDVLA